MKEAVAIDKIIQLYRKTREYRNSFQVHLQQLIIQLYRKTREYLNPQEKRN